MVEILTLRIDGWVKNVIKRVAEELGLTPSEYIRRLIYEDLDRRSILTTRIQRIKEEIR